MSSLRSCDFDRFRRIIFRECDNFIFGGCDWFFLGKVIFKINSIKNALGFGFTKPGEQVDHIHTYMRRSSAQPEL